MGFYIRKALRVGPFRFNLSKSGIGVSAGVKGLRLGAGPRGNYIHMGREGLYFRKSLDGNGRKKHTPTDATQMSPASVREDLLSLDDVDSGSVLDMVDASSIDLMAELNEKAARIRMLPAGIVLCLILIIGSLIGGAPGWCLAIMIPICVVTCWLIRLKDEVRKTTVILYDLEPEIERLFQDLHNEFRELCTCRQVWYVEAQGEVNDLKYNAGASSVVKRSQTSLQTGLPTNVKSNIEVPLVPVGTQTLAFFPDRLIVFDSTGIGAVSYHDLSIDYSETNSIEQGLVPGDATVIGTTWRYINKKGGPDRRFKDNRELSICAYEQVHFTSATGLNEIIQLSRRSSANRFVAALQSMHNLDNI